jgi:hypothetical protein
MAVRSSSPTLPTARISQYETSKPLCDRLNYSIVFSDATLRPTARQSQGVQNRRYGVDLGRLACPAGPHENG